MMQKLAAEFIGTAALVLIGCGAAVLAGFGLIGQLGIALAFGLAVCGLVYGLGPVSGCHINPAISVGAWLAGRISRDEMVGYVVAQCFGAIVGAGVLLVIASGAPGYSVLQDGLGQNGWGLGYNGEYQLISAGLFEALASFILVLVALGSTQRGVAHEQAGIAIGLTLAAIHIVGIQVTGVSVNPARSLGPAVWAAGEAINQLWLFFVAPLAGAAIAGLAFKSKFLTSAET